MVNADENDVFRSLTWLELGVKCKAISAVPFALPWQVVANETGAQIGLDQQHPIVVLPAMLHGALGREIQRLACRISSADCRCDPENPCIFGRVFKRPDGAVPGLLLAPSYHTPSGPFYVEGSTFEFSVILAGKCAVYAPLVEEAIQSAGLSGIGPRGLVGPGRSRFEVLDIDPKPGRLKPDRGPELGCDVVFDTPVVFKEFSEAAVAPDFPLFWKSCRLRVMQHLDKVYGEGKWRDWQYDREADAAIQAFMVEDWAQTWRHHYDKKRRHDRAVVQTGFAGTVRYVGNMRPFWPVMRLAEVFGLGTNTSLGFGRFRLKPLQKL